MTLATRGTSNALTYTTLGGFSQPTWIVIGSDERPAILIKFVSATSDLVSDLSSRVAPHVLLTASWPTTHEMALANSVARTTATAALRILMLAEVIHLRTSYCLLERHSEQLHQW